MIPQIEDTGMLEVGITRHSNDQAMRSKSKKSGGVCNGNVVTAEVTSKRDYGKYWQ
jgi:hypothetical protein